MDRRFLRPGIDFALAHASQEAGELVAAIGKTQCFGLLSVNPLLPPDQQETNAAWVLREMADLRGALDRLEVAIKAEGVV